MKMASQRFCLRWNNHQSNLLSVFDQLLHAETFTDVTLAVDGQYLKAHKMVLSACSPYFNALFVNHPEKHPIVILKDVPYSDMKSLLDFMYRGEVSVDQERLTAFLRVAESLRIKGLTEVNDDKPSPVAPTPPPPQLQRIQPYLVQQQQQQHQRSKSQNSLLAGSSAGAGGLASAAALAGGQNAQQQSLLSSALASMPKRKRGRPRKLSGSSNGTGNDYDEFEREGMMNDSEMGDCKMGDSYSGNDDGSDDNQRDGGDMRDPSESRDSASHSKKFKSKDNKSKQNDNDNSTSVQLINTSPELSQRLFGLIKPAATVQPQQQQQSQNDPQSGPTQTSLLQFNEQQDVTAHLPTALGLKVRSSLQLTAQPQQQQQQQQQQQNITKNTNSLLKQQLRAGLKEIPNNNTTTIEPMPSSNTDFSCSALQSLASVAERQTPNAIQPPSANNLHHQFLLHMAANPMLKPSADFFRQQQHQAQQQQQSQEQLSAQEQQQSQTKKAQSQQQQKVPSQQTQLLEQELQREDSMSPTNMDLILDQTDKSEPELTLADETAGLDYKNADTSLGNIDDAVAITTITISDVPGNENSNANATIGTITPNARSSGTSRRPVQRRRIRRKAQSTIDDQAEHLTEMSVRGLDLFRYARINEGVYQCTECAKEDLQKTFKNKYSFQRHAFLYHEGKVRKVFPCTLCGKEFSRPDKMKNHLKMAHENFVARDTNSFNPLNYLITAATAEEMQTAIFTASAAVQQQQQQQQQLAHQQQQQQKQQQHQQRSIIQDDYMDNGVSILNSTPQERDISSPTSPTSAAALLKLQSDLTIKNEIVISPSPSPEPIVTIPANATATPASAAVTKSTNMAMLQAKRITQRLEEVK
ncbi:protein tramtrack, alpha isoform isoform X1 [Anastrepha ludens]|uniref:protein tramtrack, alpha isoform isoform X1 n=1 Tax=Anastrepha ludens TaxID=28586 RepID=UPI0023B02046|nr:protein tramtrack, alpha isoform isoform X1 [Anastrepha ludens]XP_053962284.1 protein tramtrack, alpha isoform isoform X1 [Anastrepha ludens]XP_053962293.1 protein tramtrack, alpha isoform isoform X1 [Anastrepha ludens]XP_053962302.1 protein tramtrack, alpha isoform isoform X1 [Anastrepha ludens]